MKTGTFLKKNKIKKAEDLVWFLKNNPEYGLLSPDKSNWDLDPDPSNPYIRTREVSILKDKLNLRSEICKIPYSISSAVYGRFILGNDVLSGYIDERKELIAIKDLSRQSKADIKNILSGIKDEAALLEKLIEAAIKINLKYKDKRTPFTHLKAELEEDFKMHIEYSTKRDYDYDTRSYSYDRTVTITDRSKSYYGPSVSLDSGVPISVEEIIKEARTYLEYLNLSFNFKVGVKK